MKAWFNALSFGPHFGGQNCPICCAGLAGAVGQSDGHGQNLRIQIGVCWLQCLIELAGAEVVGIQT